MKKKFRAEGSQGKKKSDHVFQNSLDGFLTTWLVVFNYLLTLGCVETKVCDQCCESEVQFFRQSVWQQVAWSGNES